jgi:hypothetical protein
MCALGGVCSQALAQAQADPPTAQTPSGPYDAYIEQALQAYDAGRFAEARTLFRRAHEVSPTARTLRTIGMCSFNLGDYVDAAVSFEAALQETRKPLTGEQRKQLADLIARSNQAIGRFAVRVTPPDASLSLDGHPVTLTAQHELLVEPGRHELSVQAHGHHTVQSGLSVEGGDRATLEFHLGLIPDADSELPTPGTLQPMAANGQTAQSADPRASDSTPSHSSSSLQSTLGYTSLGVGIAGLAVFGVFGVLAIVEQNKLQEACPNGACEPSHYDQLDRYDTYKTVSTVGLIGGGALTLLGAGLLLFQPERDPNRAALEPLLGPGSVGLRGSL